MGTDDQQRVPQQLRYRGYYDEKLTWYCVTTRYDDPEGMRWLQPDPSDLDGVRTYAYVGDDPIDVADPSGLTGNPPPEPAPTPNPPPTPAPTAPAPMPTAEPSDLLTTERSIAERFGYPEQQVHDAIHQAKRRGVGGPKVRNPDVVIDGKTGDVYIKRPNGSLSPDPITNIHDEVNTLPKQRGRDRRRDRGKGWGRGWSSTRARDDAIRTGVIVGGAAGGTVVIWWVGKILAPACGPAAPVCVVVF